MHKVRYFLGTALAVVLANGCQAAGVANVPPGEALAGDADAILARCGKLAGEAATRCYDESLLAVLSRDGVRAAMLTLERIGETEERFKRDGHQYAHSIGLAALGSRDEVGTTFAECTPAYQSGCYHGVIQAYFVGTSATDSQGVGEAAVNALCEAHREQSTDRWLLFQCAHGMGHGLVMVHGHHLPRALEGCDLLHSAWEREACYGGAFMENIVNATVPHHTVGRPDHASHGTQPVHAGHDPHAGHDAQGDHTAHADPGAHADHSTHVAGAAPAADEFAALNPADPLYPCNALEERYQYACYHMQTSAILFFNGGDVAATAAACDGAPEAFRPTCYQSLGRDISAYTLQNHSRAAQLCGGLTPAYRSRCHVGYAKNLVDLTADAADGLAYCRILDQLDGKRACYEAVGEQIWVLTPDAGRRRALCSGAEEEYRGTCAAGAGLGRDAAAALP